MYINIPEDEVACHLLLHRQHISSDEPVPWACRQDCNWMTIRLEKTKYCLIGMKTHRYMHGNDVIVPQLVFISQSARFTVYIPAEILETFIRPLRALNPETARCSWLRNEDMVGSGICTRNAPVPTAWSSICLVHQCSLPKSVQLGVKRDIFWLCCRICAHLLCS